MELAVDYRGITAASAPHQPLDGPRQKILLERAAGQINGKLEEQKDGEGLL